MPIIPDYTPSQGNWNPSAPDPSVAALPGAALAGIGRDALGAADDVTDVGLKIKAVRDQDGLNKARLAFAQAKARHSEFRMRNPDQTTWAGNLTAEIAGARFNVGPPDSGTKMQLVLKSEDPLALLQTAQTVERELRTGLLWSIAIAGGTPSTLSTAGRSMRSRNCRA